ncbi:cytochrome c3 family protein [Geothrix sp. PMB-07]|uniref:cytochrome c3 family protein n=1 Tax=Geothrix sp. PMB-07 TaxID=3068640 RepID=UPI00274244D7|nr:cytochrome c3 family protein [Geothrix sp. PMB-07]WLT31921.1 cytochrome c3 family protein [Geothrix sp. PMB-07]
MNHMDRLFRFVLPLGMVALLGTVLTVGWFTQPSRFVKGYEPEQPLPFSHKLHAGTMKIPCLYCHAGADRSRVAGVPDVATCMGCHRVTKTDRPVIQALAKALELNQPIPWKRVHELPDHVFFDHRPHVNAGIACQSCHGEVQEMTVLSRQLGMRMGDCLSCHRNPKAALPPKSPILRGPEHCSACHR